MAVGYLLELGVRLDKAVTNVESWVEESCISGSVRVMGRLEGRQVRGCQTVKEGLRFLRHRFRYRD